MIVGSYREGVKFLILPWYKSLPIKILNERMHVSLSESVVSARILVNSGVLYNEYKNKAKSIELVYTTTLAKEDFFKRSDACSKPKLKLLFVGRIDLAKGLKECIAACAFLKAEGIQATLTIVGWEERGNQVTKTLMRVAEELGISDLVNFAGRKRAGPELLDFYRTHDVYLLPSYHEGFPRTIWEALANCIPVIATNVGSIPAFIKNEQEALLVQPGNQAALNAAILRMIKESDLRSSLVINGYKRVKEVQLDVQAEKIINFINS